MNTLCIIGAIISGGLLAVVVVSGLLSLLFHCPAQKPLTMTELWHDYKTRTVWVEEKNRRTVKKLVYIGGSQGGERARFRKMGVYNEFYEYYYCENNQYFRVWKEEPTKRDRRLATWKN